MLHLAWQELSLDMARCLGHEVQVWVELLLISHVLHWPVQAVHFPVEVSAMKPSGHLVTQTECVERRNIPCLHPRHCSGPGPKQSAQLWSQVKQNCLLSPTSPVDTLGNEPYVPTGQTATHLKFREKFLQSLQSSGLGPVHPLKHSSWQPCGLCLGITEVFRPLSLGLFLFETTSDVEVLTGSDSVP